MIAIVCTLVIASRFVWRAGSSAELDEHADWRRADAEVISILRVADRTFLRVRFSVGTSLVQNDVLYPLPDVVLHVGLRVPIRYDPAAPARVVFDLSPSTIEPFELGHVTTSS
ncbi:hypothetical protein [Kribbella sp. NPDC055071]